MTPAEIEALIARLEGASGADHVLDAHIHLALRGYTLHEDTDPANGHFAFWDGEPWKSWCSNCSSWSSPTASVDEALTLVPEGHAWKAGRSSLGAWAEVCADDGSGEIDEDRHWIAEAATPALALCIAALKARALLSASRAEVGS